MKKILAVAILATGLLASTSAFAQNSASTNATGSVTIIRALTISSPTNLVFGRIVRPTSGSGNVTIAASDGTLTAASPVTTAPSTNSRARFNIAGEDAQTISITLSTLTMTHTNGTDTIPVTLTGDLGSSTTLSGGTGLGSGGTATLYVGGQISVSSATVTGTYSGTFSATVAYN